MKPFWYGVGLASMASVVGNLGILFQKLSHGRHRHHHRYYVWLSGLALIVLASLADFVALGLAAQSVVAPLGSLTLVSNSIFAPILLGETFSQWDSISTFLIVIGTSTAVAFASQQNADFTIQELNRMFMDFRFILLFVSLLSLVFVMLSFITFIKRSHWEPTLSHTTIVRTEAFLYAALAGTVGSQNVMFAKAIAVLFRNWVLKALSPFSSWELYLLICCLSTTSLLQIKWINKALKLYDTIFVVPIFEVFWIVISVISGLVFFEEYREFTVFRGSMFVFGIVVTVIVIGLMTHHKIDMEELETQLLHCLERPDLGQVVI